MSLMYVQSNIIQLLGPSKSSWVTPTSITTAITSNAADMNVVYNSYTY